MRKSPDARSGGSHKDKIRRVRRSCRCIDDAGVGATRSFAVYVWILPGVVLTVVTGVHADTPTSLYESAISSGCGWKMLAQRHYSARCQQCHSGAPDFALASLSGNRFIFCCCQILIRKTGVLYLQDCAEQAGRSLGLLHISISVGRRRRTDRS